MRPTSCGGRRRHRHDDARAGRASVIALSYGERGESGELWKEPGQTVERVKEIRHAEAEAAAEALGADVQLPGPRRLPARARQRRAPALADVIREFGPDVLITHTDTDPFNPDHPVAYEAVERARSLAAGAGVASAFKTITPPQLFLFEPHQPELCNFTPTDVRRHHRRFEAKREAMAEMKAQKYLQTYYAQRAEQRGNHARRASGRPEIRHAEAFQRVLPQVVDGAVSAELARWASPPSTRRQGARADRRSTCARWCPGSRACGPAGTVRCGQGDNLMVHAAMADARPGEVLVLTMPEPAPVALLGDLLATQAKARGVAAMLVDAAVRDADELGELGLPIWARWVRVRGATKDVRGRAGRAGDRGRRAIRPGDIVVLDADGAAVVAAERVKEVLGAPRARGGRARQARAARRPASSPTTSTACAARRVATSPTSATSSC